jgi:hypothetical protein
MTNLVLILGHFFKTRYKKFDKKMQKKKKKFDVRQFSCAIGRREKGRTEETEQHSRKGEK